jgi:threonine dehydratase
MSPGPEIAREPSDGVPPLPVQLADVEAAVERIRGQVQRSPVTYSELFSKRCGSKVHFKLENLQMTGSYKERGALNFILQLTPEQRARGVVTASAGNHAQGLAYHATRLGLAATIVMPLGTPLIKITRTRRFGGNVILHGNDLRECYARAQEVCHEQGATFVPPFDHPHIVAGQGTVGMELLEQLPYLDAVVVPVGGGGLVAGVGVAIKEVNPRIRVIGVEALAFPAMKAALDRGELVDVPPGRTIADGIAVWRAGTVPFQVAQRYVDEVVTVDETAIASAVLELLENEKIVAEGAGATPVAALLTALPGLKNKRVCCIISGGNIDVNVLSVIIERGLVAQGRRIQLAVTVPDRPGSLSDLTRRIAEHRANVLQIHHDRAFSEAPIGDTVVEVMLETRGMDHAIEIVGALEQGGFSVKHSLNLTTAGG